MRARAGAARRGPSCRPCLPFPAAAACSALPLPRRVSDTHRKRARPGPAAPWARARGGRPGGARPGGRRWGRPAALLTARGGLPGPGPAAGTHLGAARPRAAPAAPRLPLLAVVASPRRPPGSSVGITGSLPGSSGTSSPGSRRRTWPSILTLQCLAPTSSCRGRA